MESEDKMHCTIALSVIFGVIGFIAALYTASEKHEEAMAKLGYSHVMAVGNSSPVWQKLK